MSLLIAVRWGNHEAGYQSDPNPQRNWELAVLPGERHPDYDNWIQEEETRTRKRHFRGCQCRIVKRKWNLQDSRGKLTPRLVVCAACTDRLCGPEPPRKRLVPDPPFYCVPNNDNEDYHIIRQATIEDSWVFLQKTKIS